ncbi:hypothetical protein FOA43_001413 [Brettanomyces nanus]|uniref:ML-like domain-containing protein n=1 Tax=Eeniella nana TaxID=13502 RepID=A0A875S1X8_EENNA|nr:uncharacterized protein FOA43_001413 [Brettanomyces nanus]QPG74092.1 hypothetical protein FOA43_001413 [Brettanomyces nanus]
MSPISILLPIVSLLSCFISTACAKYIKTDSLLTCMQNSEFSSSYFEVIYYPANKSIYYQIDGTSSISGKVAASVELIVYGLNVYETTINLCDFDVDTICPLTAGHLDISGTYKIDSDDIPDIPAVAYGVPDLDAYVQVHIYKLNSSGKVTKTEVACLQATLTNGKTVQTKYAAWPIACISGFGLVVSSIFSLFGHSTTAWHIASNAASLFIYFQSLATIAMMGVAKVPPIAAAWAQNFMWTLGIVKVDFMQDMLYWYIQSTGGTVSSILTNQSVISIAVQKMVRRMARSLFKRAVTVATGSATDVLEDSNLYTTDEQNVGSKILVLRGIKRVAYLSGIEISNIFMTSMVYFLFVGFVMIILIGFFKALVEILFRTNCLHSPRFNWFRQHWVPIIKGLLFRLFHITFTQITLMCIWEFTRNDSAGCIAFAVIIALVSWALMCYATYRIFMAGRRSQREQGNPAYFLFGDAKFLSRFGFMYTQYKAGKYYWLPVLLFFLFVRALLIAVLQSHGKVCAVMIFAIELIYAAVVIWKRPFMDKRTTVFNIFIAVVNLVNSIIFLFFSNVFNNPQVVSSVAAIVFFILNAVFALILLIMIIVSCTLALVHRNPDSRYGPFKDDRAAFVAVPEDRKSKVEYELEELGAAAMRGHKSVSMLPEAGDPESKLATESSLTNNYSSSTNPFDVDGDAAYGNNNSSSNNNNNSNGQNEGSELHFTSGNAHNNGETGYSSNYNWNYDTGYNNNNSARTRANETASGSSGHLYNAQGFHKRSVI